MIGLDDPIDAPGGFYDVLVSQSACTPALEFLKAHYDHGDSFRQAIDAIGLHGGVNLREARSWLNWGIEQMQAHLSVPAYTHVCSRALDLQTHPMTAVRIARHLKPSDPEVSLQETILHGRLRQMLCEAPKSHKVQLHTIWGDL